METYLEDEAAVTPEMLRRALRAATLDLTVVPVLCGSAFKNKGIQPLLDAVDYLSPLDVPPVHGVDPRTEHDLSRRPAVDEPFAALAFKVMTDPYVGKLTYVRVYSGRITQGDKVLNTTTGKTERLGRILQMHANHREERDEIGAGEIAALVGLKQTTTGETLAVDTAPIRLEAMSFLDPVISVAIEPKTKADQDKLANALQRPAEEDLTFRVRRRGDGADAYRRDGRAAPRDHRRPAVARVLGRRERRPPAGRLPRDGRQAGGEDRGPLRPPDRRPRPVRTRRHRPRAAAPATATSSSTRSSAARFRASTSPPSTSASRRRWSRASSPATRSSTSASSAGRPYHDVDSSEMAFKVAGSMAFKAAMQRAKPKLLEPVMAVEVVTPEEYLGDVG